MPTGVTANSLAADKDVVECAIARGLTLDRIVMLYHIPPGIVDRIVRAMDAAANDDDTTRVWTGCADDGGMCDRCNRPCSKRRGHHRHRCPEHR